MVLSLELIDATSHCRRFISSHQPTESIILIMVHCVDLTALVLETDLKPLVELPYIDTEASGDVPMHTSVTLKGLGLRPDFSLVFQHSFDVPNMRQTSLSEEFSRMKVIGR
jgi:hypothetical protein